MVASHKYRPTRIGRFKDLPEGREPETASKAIVSPDDYPKLWKMSLEALAEIERLRASLIDLHAEYTICIDIHSSFHRSH